MPEQDDTSGMGNPWLKGSPWRWLVWAFLFVLAILIVATVLTTASRGSSASYAPQPYEGTALDGLATDFRLVDQKGATVALSDFRGQVVVLAFLDSQCQDVCPLTAVHLRQAYQMLDEEEAASVVFFGVNVNAEANMVADVRETTEKWRLNEIPAWHFLTGSRQALEPVWEAYHITVWVPPGEEGEIVHTPGVYLIDQAGQKRWYISSPFDEEGKTEWTVPLSELLVKHIRELLG